MQNNTAKSKVEWEEAFQILMEILPNKDFNSSSDNVFTAVNLCLEQPLCSYEQRGK